MGRIQIMGLVTVALICLGGQADEVIAAPRGGAVAHRGAMPRAGAAGLVSEPSAQRRRVRRPPLRITIRRGFILPPGTVRSGLRIDFFPRPYPYEWPGPFAKRDCVAWLAAEARPSGPVVVPRRRCWWIPG